MTACCSPLGARRMALHRQFAETPPKDLALELGGNTRWGVERKDIDSRPRSSSSRAYLSAGQRCTAARRADRRGCKEGPANRGGQGAIDRLIVGEPFADPNPSWAR